MTYIFVILLLVAFELLYLDAARRLGIVDKACPDCDGSPSLRGGGIVFPAALWAWAAFFGIGYPWMLAGATLIATVSFADDLRSLSVGLRLAVHFAACAMLLAALGVWTLPLCVGASALVAAVGVVNAWNFMDGINGITGAYSLAVLLPMLWVDTVTPFVDNSLIIVVAIAVAIFLVFNFRPRALCFAGDVGSITLGFIVTFLLGALVIATKQWYWLLLVAVYGVDSVLTILRRLLMRQNIFAGHRMHAYQLLVHGRGISPLLVAASYALLQVAISAALILMPHAARWPYAAVVLAALSAAYLIISRNIPPPLEKSHEKT